MSSEEIEQALKFLREQLSPAEMGELLAQIKHAAKAASAAPVADAGVVATPVGTVALAPPPPSARRAAAAFAADEELLQVDQLLSLAQRQQRQQQQQRAVAA